MLTNEEQIRFKELLKREPSKEEWAVCDALWSEHCSYKSSKVHLKRLHTSEEWVVQGPGENAGVISINKNWGIAFKMESHNHPSYIEPYQGAATGVGGILRDVFCMGARPIANMNCLRFGDGERMHALVKGCVKGIGDYGNSVGVPTVSGQTSFHYGYSKNILVNAFTAGVIHKEKIFKGVVSEETNVTKLSEAEIAKLTNGTRLDKETEKLLYPEKENVLVYFGSATGRDGVHGATMSSDEFSGSGGGLRPTVQVGDPFAEKLLLEATLALIEENLVVGLQDMGAAGLTSSSVEMAGRSGCGVTLDLDAIPKRAHNLSAWELLLSESQERMLCAVRPDMVEKVMKRLADFDLPSAVVGHVNHTGKFICVFDKTICTSVEIDHLLEGVPRYEWPLQDKQSYLNAHKVIQNKSPSSPLDVAAHKDIKAGINLQNFVERYPNTLTKLMADPMFCSRTPLYSHYCSTVQGNTVSACGTLQSSAAAVVRLPRYAQESANGKTENTGIAVAAGCEEIWIAHDPKQGTALSMLKLARKIVASGGHPLAITDCMNFGSMKLPAVSRQFSDAIDGMNDVAKRLHIPIVSGNVSLNNQTDGEPIPPTPMIGMVGKVDNVTETMFNALGTEDETPETHLYLLRSPSLTAKSTYLSSRTAWILGGESVAELAPIDFEEEEKCWNALHHARKELRPKLCMPVGHGGVLGTLFECALNSKRSLQLEKTFWDRAVADLMSEGRLEFILGLNSKESEAALSKLFASRGFVLEKIGSLQSKEPGQGKNSFPQWHSIQDAWNNGLKSYFK